VLTREQLLRFDRFWRFEFKITQETMMNKYVVEFIGTFFLVFTIGNVVVEPGAGNLAPLAIGGVLMVMIFAGGHISGAHYNPAVTLAVFLRGKCDAKDVGPYLGAQVAAAAIAAKCVLFLKGPDAVIQAMDLSAKIPQVILAEILFTFALAFVILSVATAKGTEGNSFYGLAIGFTVMAGAFAVGGISGGVFNPAVAVGISVIGLSSWANIWVYLVANFAGGALAAFVFKFVNPAE
jgi:aquaporin Z